MLFLLPVPGSDIWTIPFGIIVMGELLVMTVLLAPSSFRWRLRSRRPFSTAGSVCPAEASAAN